MNEPTSNDREELYNETRRDLLSRQLSNSERFDGAILTLSTAYLGVSTTFLKSVVPVDSAVGLPWLITSWCMFAGAIISTLVSFVTSQAGIDRQLHLAKEYYLDGQDEALTKENKPAKCTLWLNGLSAVVFAMALLTSIIFVTRNL